MTSSYWVGLLMIQVLSTSCELEKVDWISMGLSSRASCLVAYWYWHWCLSRKLVMMSDSNRP